jgi:hypothetical protein
MKHRWIGGVLLVATLALAGCRQDAGGPATTEASVPPASTAASAAAEPSDSPEAVETAEPSGTPAATPEDYDY